MKTVNLATLEELSFDPNTTALWAVCYGYCEEHNLMSALFAAAQDNKFEDFAKKLPVMYGKKTVAAGDWTAFLEE